MVLKHLELRSPPLKIWNLGQIGVLGQIWVFGPEFEFGIDFISQKLMVP